MAIESLNQNIRIRYGSEVTSEGVNSRIKEVFGDKGKLEGLNLIPSSGLNCLLTPGIIIIDGASIEESQNIPITIESNSSGSEVIYYLYAFYFHGEGATCYYELLTSQTTSKNALLLSVVTVSDGATEITINDIDNEPISRKSNKAVLFSDLKNKAVETVNLIDVSGKSITSDGSSVLIDGKSVWTNGEISIGPDEPENPEINHVWIDTSV